MPAYPYMLALLCSSLLCGLARTCHGLEAGSACSDSVTVTVDGSSGEVARDCSEVSGSLANLTCSSLQDVLLNLSENRTLSGEGSGQSDAASTSCIEVRLHPGYYVLTKNISFLGQNLILWGERESVRVTFSFSDSFDPTVTNTPFYVLSFTNSSLIEMRGISFEDSPGIITTVNVDSVLVEDCSFRYFFQGAVDIYNCPSVIVRDSLFEHNGPVSIVKPEPYRGHSGGLSVGYYREVVVEGGPKALLSNCTFRNNTSDPQSLAVQSTSDLFQRFAFTGRGGGCAFTISPSTSLTALVENCTVEDNFVRSFGGGLYVGFDGNLNHSVTVNRVRFIRNECPGAAGGLEIGFVQGADPHSLNRIMVLNSEFIENRAGFGAGTYFFSPGPTGPEGRLSNFGHFENCTFTRNVAREYGAAIGAITLLYFQDMINLIPLEVESCTFIDNDDGGGGGVLSTAYLPLRFSGHSVFMQNRGRTLVVIGAHVEIRGGMHFYGNDGAGIDGGAMYITSFGQMEMFKGANITFTGNTGVIGAGMVIDVPQVPPVYSRLAHNPLCTLLYEDSTRRPEDWEEVSFGFSGNSAIIASGVYLNNLDLCSWVQDASPSFEPSRVFHWHFVEFSETNQNTAHEPDDFNQEWSVQTSAAVIRVTSNVTEAYPGEQFSLGIEALDEINRPTSDIIRITDLSDNVESAFLFEPSAVTLSKIALAAVNTSYLSPTKFDIGSSRQLQVELVLGTTSFDMAELRLRRCLPGYVLSESSLSQRSYKTCDCDTENTRILECKGEDILLSAGLWATEDNSSAGDSIVMYPCPPGYCRCVPIAEGSSVQCHFVFRSSEPNSQCSCDRNGELCGECKGGKGVSALLNKCTTCSDVSGLLIALLMVLDAAVFMVLLIVMKPLPIWAYPCVFYLQVLPYLTEHFPATFDQIQPALYYISSALSFYFVYDFCLYSSLSPLTSYFIRYLPLFIVVITASIVLSIRRYLKKYALSWHGLWWIVLLLYTHVLHTSMSILNCPILPDRDGSHEPRWYIAANIKCFNGHHTALGLLAILVLGLCLAVIPLSLAYIMGWLQRPWVLRRLFEPLVVPFKEQYKWWSSVELGRRVILVLFIVSFPQNEYPATFILMVLTAIYGYVQPFREKAVNILEVVLSVDTIILLLLRRAQTFRDELGMTSVAYTISQGNTSSSDCTEDSGSITGFSWLLFPFYYLPLVISCTVAVAWSIFQIKSLIRTKWRPQPHQQQEAFHDSLLVDTVWTASTTEVGMSWEMTEEDDSLAYTELHV